MDVLPPGEYDASDKLTITYSGSQSHTTRRGRASCSLCLASPANFIYGRVLATVFSHVTIMPVLLRPVNKFWVKSYEMRQRGKTILWTTLHPAKWPFKNTWTRGSPYFHLNIATSPNIRRWAIPEATWSSATPHSVAMGTRVHVASGMPQWRMFVTSCLDENRVIPEFRGHFPEWRVVHSIVSPLWRTSYVTSPRGAPFCQ